MKKFARQMAILISALMLISAIPASAYEEISANISGNSDMNLLGSAIEKTVLYVAPNGNDSAKGTIDAPLATLNGARDKIRALKNSTGTIPYGGVTVYVRGGTYSVTEPFVLEEQDSGLENARILYKAYEDEKPVFSGGVTLNAADFTVDSTDSNLAVYDLSKAGINAENIGILPYSGSSGSYSVELFKDEEPMYFAQYPNVNDGFIDITQSNILEGADGNANYKISITDEEIRAKLPSWSLEVDGRASGFWNNNFSIANYLLSVDTQNNSISTSGHSNALKAGQRFYVYNMKSELDLENEYYIDRENNKLYVRATLLNNNSNLVLSKYNDYFIYNSTSSSKGASYVTIDGLNFEYSRSGGYFMYTAATNYKIINCSFKNLANYAMMVRGNNNLISHNIVKNTDKGIYVSAGACFISDLCGTKIEYNDISNFARISKMYTAGINLGGGGVEASNNKIYNSPHLAIGFWGNKHLIKNNDIHDVLLSTSDAGAIYAHIGTNGYSFRGTEIINNYFHNLGTLATSPNYEFTGAGSYRYGIYMDGFCGSIIEGNLFDKCEHGVNINSGRDNKVINNVFLRNENQGNPIRLTGLGAGKTLADGVEVKTLFWSDYTDNKATYDALYPELSTITATNYSEPWGNEINGNYSDSSCVSDNIGAKKYFAFQGLSNFTLEDAEAHNDIAAPFVNNSLTDAVSFNSSNTSASLNEALDENLTLDVTFGVEDDEETVITDNEIKDTTYPKIGLYSLYDHNKYKEYAMDGDPSTFWMASDNGSINNCWIEMDLNDKYLVSGIKQQGIISGSNYVAMGSEFIEVSNDRINYTRVFNGYKDVNDASLQSADERIVKFEPVYARYIRIRKNGSTWIGGMAEMSPILESASSDSVPKVRLDTIGMSIKGTLASGGTIFGEYLYYNAGKIPEGLSEYTYYTATTNDNKSPVKAVAVGTTTGEYPKYEIKPEDAGKFIQLAIIPKDENGNRGTRAVTAWYKIADKDESTTIMNAVNTLKGKLSALNLNELSGAVTLPTAEQIGVSAVKYSSQNPAFLSDEGSLISAVKSGAGIIPNAENGDSTTYYNAELTFADGKTANYIFPATIKAKNTQTYARLNAEANDYYMYSNNIYPSKVAKDNEDNNVYTMSLGIGYDNWSGTTNTWYTATFTRWADNIANTGDYRPLAFTPGADASQPATKGTSCLITDQNQSTAASLYIANMHFKAIDKDYTIDDVKGINNMGYKSSGMSDTISYASGKTLKTDEWLNVQVVSSIYNANSRTFGAAFKNGRNSDGTKLNNQKSVYADDITVEPLKVGSVKIKDESGNEIGENGLDITIPNGDNIAQTTLKSTVYNQFGTTLGMTETDITPQQTVSYRIVNPVKGVKIDAKTGILTVTSEAPAGATIEVEALVDKNEAQINSMNFYNNNVATASKGVFVPMGAGTVKSSINVTINNASNIKIASDLSDDNALATKPYTVCVASDSGVAITGAKWLISNNKYGSYTQYEQISSETFSDMLTDCTVVLPENLGGKYIKLQVVSEYNDIIESEPQFIEYAVSTDQLYILGNDVRKEKFNIISGEKLTGTRTVTNNSSNEISVVIILARYSKNGNLLDTSVSPSYKIEAGKSENVQTFINIPEQLSDGEYVTSFIMSDNIKPYANSVIVNQ